MTDKISSEDFIKAFGGGVKETEHHITTENKGDLISRDALKKALDEQMNFEENCRDSVFDIIDNAPTISPFKAIHDELHKGEEE